MARGRGGIPPYGKNFHLVSADKWSPEYNSSMYAWKGDTDYYIRSDKTSKKWWVFHRGMPVSGVFPSLTVAMDGFLKAVTALRIEDIRVTEARELLPAGSNKAKEN